MQPNTDLVLHSLNSSTGVILAETFVAGGCGVRWTTPFRIELSDDERGVLAERARSSNAPYRQVIRARIVLYAAQGMESATRALDMESATIADRLDCTRSFVSRVRKRFFEERLNALEERPRSGRPARFSP